MEPVFRKAGGKVILANSEAANAYQKPAVGFTEARPEEEVVKKARAAVERLRGDGRNHLHVLGQYTVQFGRFQGVTFKWLLENALGYAAYIAHDIKKETLTGAPISFNKFELKEYLFSFAEGKEAYRRQEDEERSRLGPAAKRPRTPVQESAVPSSSSNEPAAALDQHQTGVTQEVADEGAAARRRDTTSIPLLQGWKDTLPQQDHLWVSKALFHFTEDGRPELDMRKVDRLWFHPPPAPLVSQVPKVEKHFTHRLLLWMPMRLWKVQLNCPNSGCHGRQLALSGIYNKVRAVIDLDDIYYVGCERLQCGSCKQRFQGWSEPIMEQLDIPHRWQFPVLLTYHQACDVRVIRLMRQRTLGNSSTLLQRQIEEQHGERWLTRCAQYLSETDNYRKAVAAGLVLPRQFPPPPSPPKLPTYKWWLTAYCRDVRNRLPDIKAAITSTFGSVLKIDSTKKIAKKLAGLAERTAGWSTNVGNEYGQVLASVLTATEGEGLKDMVLGLVSRYKTAGVKPPDLMYVDRDCCGESVLRRSSKDWPDLLIRLDIWHFMRRLATCVTTESHALYATFMGHMAKAIFVWNDEDVRLLTLAKRAELVASGFHNPSDGDVRRAITKKEMALHCRKVTRGTTVTTSALDALIANFLGEGGKDAMGTPLLDPDEIEVEWRSQKRHVACIQDPQNYSLYTKIGTITKGGVELPTFRCARGSVSLESFRLHLNRFIPGTVASDVHFQAYLLDGLARWNEDRAEDLQVISTGEPRRRVGYSSLLKATVNNLSQNVFGTDLVPGFKVPMKYTGEKMGVEYLYHQTGRVLQHSFDEDREKAAVEEDMEADPDEPDAQSDDLTVPEYQEEIQPVPPGYEDDPPLPGPSRHQEGPQPHRTLSSSDSDVSPIPELESSDDGDGAVGPDNVPGYEKVCALSGFLFNLKDQQAPLSSKQAEKIVFLWKDMDEYDKRPSKLARRSKGEEPQGRFKRSKRPKCPGAESTARCFVGSAAGPAQWPDANRYMEVLLIKLCEEFPSDKRVGTRTTSRWTLVTCAYRHIVTMVVDCPTVNRHSSLQLLSINNHTLIHWYNKREQAREVRRAEARVGQASLPAPEGTFPAVREPVLPVPQPAAETHTFPQPEDTAGQAVFGRRVLPAPGFPDPAPHPGPGPQTVTLLLLPPGVSLIQHVANIPQQPAEEPGPMSPKTRKERFHARRKAKLEAAGNRVRRYTKPAQYNCSQCDSDRNDGRHRQYFGSWYCPAKCEDSVDEWLAKKKEERNDKRGQTK